MSTIKSALKAAKSAIDAKRWDEAIQEAHNVLAIDKNNNFAYLFLGRAQQQKGQPEEAEKAYRRAAELKPEDTQAWLGLRDLYEHQGSKKVAEYTEVGLKLAEIYAAADDKHRSQTAINKLTDFAKKNGSRVQYHAALQTQLPTSPVYSFLEGRLPHPFLTYVRLAEITEQEETERINKLIAERRTRLGARLGQVTTETKREIYTSSSLEEIYSSVIDWSTDDDVRREYEEKLFQRAYDTLVVLPADEKAPKREQVLKLADGMVIIKHPYRLAWEVWLEWKDVEDLEELDVDVIQQYIALFPDRGLAKVLRGFMATEISPWPQAASPTSDDESAGVALEKQLSPEDRLVLMTEGVDIAKDSYLAFRLMSDYFLHLTEYESAVEVARKSLKSLANILIRSGLQLQGNEDAVNSTLATSLVYYQAPRNHSEAKAIFEDIIGRKKNFTPALIGIGLILEEEQEYTQAMEFLNRALAKDPMNFRIGAEAAWCKALTGDYSNGLAELQSYSQGMEVRDSRTRDLKAQTLYRIGVCQWELDPSKAARKDRKGAYASFLASIKTDPSCAPAYTALGIYYEEFAKDKKRARQCFQKAFELSPAEVVAAERLARSFADTGDWEIVEVVAQRVVDSGRARPAPGSKKKGISWPFSALGIVQMNRLEFQQAIVSFLAALRIKPDDYHSYVGLGESYHNSGRYNSALRTFTFAQTPPEDVEFTGAIDGWFTEYMLANVHRELGDYEEAVNGYREVLASRPDEFGVSIALLQTLTERAWRGIETGFFGQAIDSAKEAIEIACRIAEYKPEAFNLWKAVGDAFAIYSYVQDRAREFPHDSAKQLLTRGAEAATYAALEKTDELSSASISSLMVEASDSSSRIGPGIKPSLVSAVLAHKRAMTTCANDIHARAVSWYNLGWTEYRAHVCLEARSSTEDAPTKYLHASMRCFKRAIELEAGNTDFWNALGVVTSKRSPKVAQHAFVRSLHLNERSPKTWTNLGALYLLQSDNALAHQAFVRAQSTDPDYAPAWVGEGILALLLGDAKEARLHFTHAFEIGTADVSIVKELFANSSFDFLASNKRSINVDYLIRPLFAMGQLCAQDSTAAATPYQHLLSLLQERGDAHLEAATHLNKLTSDAEADFERTESANAMFRFASAKADLARNLLAAEDCSAAIEAAETVLDLTNEEGGGIDTASQRRLRLSAHLTLGLAQYYQKDFDAALSAFKAALTESDSNPDIVCLLAQVLWARGSPEERSVARDQLFETIEKHTGHVRSICLLGVMGVLDKDVDVCEAVKDELEILRMSESISEKERRDVERVLEAVTAAIADGSETTQVMHDTLEVPVEELNEIQQGIMLAPSHPQAWAQLADLAPEEPVPGHMAVRTAMQSVPPKGSLEADGMAEVLAGAMTVANAQMSVMTAPWKVVGWKALEDTVRSVS